MHNSHAIDILTCGQWQDLSRRFRDDNYQQGWAYGRELAARHHAECEHVAVRSAGELLGVASVRLRRVPVVGGGIAYISSGPLTRMDRRDDIDRLTLCLDLLRIEYVEDRGLNLRILAPLGSPQWNDKARTAFERAGLRPGAPSRSYRTFLLDIDRPPEKIRAGCSKYWRRNLRRAESRPFTVRSGVERDLFEPIRALYAELRQRKRFHAPLDADFYTMLQQKLDGDERFVASLVECDGSPAAGLIVSMQGDTCVPLVLAADESGLRNYAVYLLQWRSIDEARQRGMRYYDLGGIDPEENEGVYNFKKGLRGVDLRAPGPFETAPSGLRAMLTRGAETIHHRLRPAA